MSQLFVFLNQCPTYMGILRISRQFFSWLRSFYFGLSAYQKEAKIPGLKLNHLPRYHAGRNFKDYYQRVSTEQYANLFTCEKSTIFPPAGPILFSSIRNKVSINLFMPTLNKLLLGGMGTKKQPVSTFLKQKVCTTQEQRKKQNILTRMLEPISAAPFASYLRSNDRKANNYAFSM